MSAFTDMLLPDRGSGEKEKTEQNDEGDPLPGTARHREFYPEGVAEILRVSFFASAFIYLCINRGTDLDCALYFPA
jgi:endoribonuclease Dicer